MMNAEFEYHHPKPKVSEYHYPTAFSRWDSLEEIAINRVIRSGRFTMGAEVAAFEEEFANYHGSRYGVMVNSGSSANLLMVATLAELGLIKRGDKVVVPALAWSTTYAPLVQYGLELILVDCDQATWNADYWSKEFNPQDAKLIMACSILGNPAPLEDIKSIAGVIVATLLEDNCESLGAATNWDRVHLPRVTGTYGLMNSFSFFYSHQLSAIEGGMILTNDEDCYLTCKVLRAHGWTRDVEPTPPTFDEEYNFSAFGFNVRPTEIHAAVGREQLKKLDGFIKHRRANLEFFRLLTDGYPIQLQQHKEGSSPFGIAFTVESQTKRAKLARALREQGIDCRLPTGGSFRLHKYGEPWANQLTPNADYIHTHGMFLGNGPFDLSHQIERAVDVLKKELM